MGGAPASIAPESEAPAANTSAPGCYWQTFLNALRSAKVQSNLWAQNLVWGGEHHEYAQVARVNALWFTCMVGARYLLWPLLEWGLSAALTQFTKYHNSDATAPALGFTSSSPPGPSATVDISNNIITAALDWMRQINNRTASAFHTRSDPTGSYDPFSTPSSRVEIVCKWILRMVMCRKFMRLAISNSALGDFKNCYDAAWARPISPSGTYNSALHFGWTASICSVVERIIISGMLFKLFQVQVHSIVDPIHQVVGCLPWYSRISGELCPLWVWKVNSSIFHILTPTGLSAVIALNIFALAHWSTPRRTNAGLVLGKIATILALTHINKWYSFVPMIAFYSPVLQPPTRFMLAKRFMLKTYLLVVPITLLLKFTWVTGSYQAAENWMFITGTAVILTLAKESVEPKWNALLQWLRIAPWDINIGRTQQARGAGVAGREAKENE
ncbi:uncharacterized protein M421DRAFT_205291 [Didymella exigua CBS 183.55]|uniref:Uncharacterized protein n=1 Tax=Didymella exigua CBS 183.55 TaxID=1150837 RepID=A0A6A5REJ7_9PLEO|nr:uncharacterized protein M421DRAFT_205291 [Didymella exigua CBS 183.55]KAF1926711.1 hypothetical protein M421DRAFT_205291 [Didymella exigua CBS 183.55]